MVERPRSIEGSSKRNESIESPELFRATLGFDFIFTKGKDGKKRCLCIEINGEDSGIFGIQDIPDGEVDKTQKLVAKVRTAYDFDRFRRYALLDDLESGEFSVTPEGRDKIKKFLLERNRQTPMVSLAYRTPKYIQNISLYKPRQQTFIPDEHKPRQYLDGESPESSTGFWICKPNIGRHGNNIMILSNVEFKRLFIKTEEAIRDNYTVQEFIFSDGADKAPESLHGNPASMRFLIDFRYLDNNKILSGFEAGYQRVSPHQGEYGTIPPTMGLAERQRLFVQSKIRGARSLPASEEEMRLAREAAEKIIHRLANGYRENLDDETKSNQ